MEKSLSVMKCVLVKEAEIKYTTRTLTCDTIAGALKEYGLNSSADEKMVLVCLDIHMNIIGIHEVAHGSINVCGLKMADIYKRALLNNASNIVLAHNHPCGELKPSRTDVQVTEKIIKKLLKLVDY